MADIVTRCAVTIETRVQSKDRRLTVPESARSALGIDDHSGHRLHVLIEPLEGGETYSGVTETYSGPELYGRHKNFTDTPLDRVLEPDRNVRVTFTALDD